MRGRIIATLTALLAMAGEVAAQDDAVRGPTGPPEPEGTRGGLRAAAEGVDPVALGWAVSAAVLGAIVAGVVLFARRHRA